jgi:hypothetical protein
MIRRRPIGGLIGFFLKLAALAGLIYVLASASACGRSASPIYPYVLGPRATAYSLSEPGASPTLIRVLLFVPDNLLQLSSVSYNLTDDLDAAGNAVEPVSMGRLGDHPDGVCYYFDFQWSGTADGDAQVIAITGGTRFWDTVQLSLDGMPAWPY